MKLERPTLIDRNPWVNTTARKLASRGALFSILTLAFVIVFTACEIAGDGEWVTDSANIQMSEPPVVYFITETKTTLEDPEEIAADEDEGQYDRCLLLPFKKQSNVDANGKHIYRSGTSSDLVWKACVEVSLVDRPPLDINSIPDVYASQMGIDKLIAVFQDFTNSSE